MITTFLASTALALVTQVTSAFVPPSTIQVAQWSTYEMTLTATDQYDTYASVDLTGVFTGPDGRSVDVKGFWDGGATFKIRFTPTVEGLWTFMTVSDDPGLDGRLGSIRVVKAEPGAHGFVRQVAADRQATEDRQAAADLDQWQFDDETRAAKELTALPALGHLDLAALRALDRQVATASTAGRLAGVVLFDLKQASSGAIPQSAMYQYVQYMTARFGAFPNVVWCLHPSAADAGQENFWRAAAQMTSALDPYFASDTDRACVLLEVCTPDETPAELSSESLSAGSGSESERAGGHVVLAAQTLPNPVQTEAVEGTVRESDAAAGHVIGRAADGVEHVLRETKEAVVHDKAMTELFEGLEEGSHIVVQSADRIGEDVNKIEGRVTHIDRPKQELTIALDDGSKRTVRLGEHAASEAAATGEATNVVVDYTNKAGERVVELFKRIR